MKNDVLKDLEVKSKEIKNVVLLIKAIGVLELCKSERDTTAHLQRLSLLKKKLCIDIEN